MVFTKLLPNRHRRLRSGAGNPACECSIKGGAISLGPRSIPEAADRPRGGLETALLVCVISLEPQSLFKENSFALNTCASAEEKIAQFWRVEVAIVLWVEAEKDFAARGEVILQIV